MPLNQMVLQQVQTAERAEMAHQSTTLQSFGAHIVLDQQLYLQSTKIAESRREVYENISKVKLTVGPRLDSIHFEVELS